VVGRAVYANPEIAGPYVIVATLANGVGYREVDNISGEGEPANLVWSRCYEHRVCGSIQKTMFFAKRGNSLLRASTPTVGHCIFS
jgi:hypothetical protein